MRKFCKVSGYRLLVPLIFLALYQDHPSNRAFDLSIALIVNLSMKNNKLVQNLKFIHVMIQFNLDWYYYFPFTIWLVYIINSVIRLWFVSIISKYLKTYTCHVLILSFKEGVSLRVMRYSRYIYRIGVFL